ncbi:cytochrome P450 [Aeromicrobium halocynthiae]|uniref:Cytochrome P450 n=1 Tax=Aeromicrobium halocynthiae TaxID=560557 RepID=A0ABP5HR47_9ACTN
MSHVTRAPRRSGGLPWIGHTPEYVRDPQAFMARQHERYGPVSEARMLGDDWTMLIGPDACEQAFRNADKAFASGPGWGRLVGPFFHRGLMLLDFEEHHRHRRALQGAFTRAHVAAYTDALQDPVATTIAQWPAGSTQRVYDLLKTLTLGVATEVFMGESDADPDELAEVNRAFVDCVQAATTLVRVPLPGTRWRRAQDGRRRLEEFFGSRLAARRERPGDDLFSVLATLTDDDGALVLSDADVVNHMIFLLMAAHDTSTITVSTMVQLLGQHPEWQERCRAEAMTLGERPSLEDLEGLVDLDLVMREALRIVPPVPVVARETVKDTEVLGVPIPAGRFVAVMLHHTHHMPEIWTDPDRFDPERFSPERREDARHRHAWDPFGGGVHKCLGLVFARHEVLTIVAHLLRTRTWRVDPAYVAPLSYVSLPFPTDGLPVTMHRLQPAPA